MKRVTARSLLYVFRRFRRTFYRHHLSWW